MDAAEAWARAKLEIAEAGAAEVEMDLDEQPGPELLPAGTWRQPAADPQVTIEWVAEHLGQEVAPADAPSGTAWSLLRWARADPAAFWQAWCRVIAGRLPLVMRD